MDWLTTLITNPDSIAHILMVYAIVIALGMGLGHIKIFGVSLGVTFVLFVGLALNYFGFQVNATVLNFVRDFGLILFVFFIGLQVGPSFFSSFKKEEAYRKDYTSERHFRESVSKYIDFYNNIRTHQTLNYKTPASFESKFTK